MKKDLKKAISKLLATTMLITSAFTGVTTVNAEIAATAAGTYKVDFSNPSAKITENIDVALDMTGDTSSNKLTFNTAGCKPVKANNSASSNDSIQLQGHSPYFTLGGDENTKYDNLKIVFEFGKISKCEVKVSAGGSDVVELTAADKTTKKLELTFNAVGGTKYELVPGTDNSYPWVSKLSIVVPKATVATPPVVDQTDFIDIKYTSNNIDFVVTKGALECKAAKDVSKVEDNVITLKSESKVEVVNIVSALKTSYSDKGYDFVADTNGNIVIIYKEDNKVKDTFSFSIVKDGQKIKHFLNIKIEEAEYDLTVTEGALNVTVGKKVTAYDEATKTITLAKDANVTAESIAAEIAKANNVTATVADGVVIVTYKNGEDTETIIFTVVVEKDDTSTSESSSEASSEDENSSESSSEDSSKDENSSESSSEDENSSESSSEDENSSESSSEDENSSESSSEQSSESSSEETPADESKEYEIPASGDVPEGTGNGATLPDNDIFVDGGTGTYNEGKTITFKAPATGSGKLFTKFPKAYTKGIISFEGKVKVKGDGALNGALMEVWGKTSGGAARQDLFAIKANSGKFQLKSSVGGSHVDISDVSFSGNTEYTLKLEIDLDANVVTAYVNGTAIATNAGAVTPSAFDVDTVESVDSVAFFARDGGEMEISALKLNATMPKDPVDPNPPTPGSGALKATVKKNGVEVTNNEIAKGDDIQIEYSLKDVTGINNFTFFVDFDPDLLQYQSAVEATEANKADFVTYNNKILNRDLILIPAGLFDGNAAQDPTDVGQANIVPATGDADYDTAKYKADGTKSAKELGRIKVAGVAGLEGASDSDVTASDKDGILFILNFKAVANGTASVTFAPAASKSGKTDFFYKTPQSSQNVEAVELPGVKADDYAATVVVPAETTAPNFTYDGNGIKLVIADGKITVTGSNLDSFVATDDSNTLSISGSAGVTADELVAAIVAAATEDVTVSAIEGGVSIASKADPTKKIDIAVVVGKDKPSVNPPGPVGDAKITVGGVEIGLSKGTKGLVATVAKGAVKEVDGGVIVPIVGGTVGLKELTAEAITAENATVTAYDNADKALYATVKLAGDETEYKVQFYIYGDIDADGSVSANDATIMINAYNGLATLTELQELSGDADSDNSVSANDATLAINKFNDATVTFPIEK